MAELLPYLPPEAHKRIQRLLRKPEGSVVHGDHLPCAQVEKCLQRLLGTGMHAAIAIRTIGPDGQQGDLRLQTLADLGEAVKIRGVAGVVQGVTAAPDHVAAETPMRVLKEPRSPVL